jgi:hypothetical protein
MPDFDIKIKTEADLAAADKTADSLKDVKKGAEQGAEGFKIFGRGAHEAHAALRVLNDAIPGFAQMAHFLANRLTLLMGMGGAAIAFVKGKCDDLLKTLDELNASPGARGEWAEKLKQKAEESAVAFAVWKDHIDRVTAAEQTLEQLTERGLAQARERLGTENAISNAQRALDEARLALAEKLGQVTPEQAIKIRLEIDEADFKRQLEMKAKEIEVEIAAKTKELNQVQDRQFARASDVEVTKRAADTANAAKIKNDEKLAQDKKNLEQSIAMQQKAQAMLDNTSLADKRGMAEMKALGLGKFDPVAAAYQAALDEVGRQANIQAGLRKSIGQEEGKRTGIDTSAKLADEALADAQKRADADADLKNKLTIQVAQLNEDLTARNAENAALQSLHNQTAAVNARGAQVSEADKRRHEEAQHGYPATPQGESDYWINYGNSAIAAATSNQPGAREQLPALVIKLSDLLHEHVNRTGGDRADIEALSGRLQNLEMQMAANRQSP